MNPPLSGVGETFLEFPLKSGFASITKGYFLWNNQQIYQDYGFKLSVIDMTDIPSIDLNFGAGPSPEKSAAVQRIQEACSGTGFLSIINHGISEEVLDSCWKKSLDFFNLPESEKQKTAVPYAGYPYGFVGMEQETLAHSRNEIAAPDLKESFSVGPGKTPPAELSMEESRFVFSPNQWPQNPAGFRNTWEVCYQSFSACASRLMGLFALALGLPESWFEPFFQCPISAMRANHYPATADPPQPGQYRASAHSDYGSLTLLLQARNSSGLEILNRQHEWIPVHSSMPELVVNIGDLMERWTNGRWVSSLHRVIIPDTEDERSRPRMSLAFFQQPDWDAQIECIPSCQGQDGTQYTPVTSGRYLMERYRSTVIS